MKKLAAIPFLIFCSCIVEVHNEIIVESSFSPIEDVLGDYTIKTTLLDFSEVTCDENVTSISDGKLTLDFNDTLTKGGSDGCSVFEEWGSFPWVEGINPDILYSDYISSVTISLSKAVSTFGLELRPRELGEYTFKVSFFKRDKLIGVIDKTTWGYFNIPDAMLFASTTNDSFDKITIESNSTEEGFSMAQFRYILN